MTNRMEERLAQVRQQQQPASVVAPPEAPAREQAAPATRPRRTEGERWEDRFTRATFHIDRALLEDLAVAAERAGLSKSEFVRSALRTAIQES